jgi:hypothetical protein
MNTTNTSDEILAEIGRGDDSPEREERVGAKPPAKIRYSHDAMIDLIIAQPGISQNALAVKFGYTPAWVSTIMSSDAFKARLANRREEVVDPALTLSLEERFRGLTERSLAVLAEKLSKPSDQVPDGLALKAVELGAKALGVGGDAPPPQVPVDHLNTLAQRLIALRGTVYAPQTQPNTFEGVCHEQIVAQG